MGFEGVQREAALARFTSEELDYMRTMLDDEDISSEIKNNFLYALSNAGRLSDEEIDRYAGEANADAEDVKEGGRDLEANLDNASKAIHTARQENISGDVSRAYTELGEAGFSNSDEIVDKAQIIVSMFREFYPRYRNALNYVDGPLLDPADKHAPEQHGPKGESKANYSHSGIEPDQIETGLDELRGIDFAAFRADVETLRSAHETVSDSAGSLDTEWKATEDWTGEAKAAAEQANAAISAGGEQLVESLESAPDALEAAISDIEGKLIQFAQHLFEDVHSKGMIVNMTVNDVDECLETLAACASLPEGVKRFKDFESLEKQNIAALQEFCGGYQGAAATVHAQAKELVDSIDGIYSATIAELGQQLSDPFAASAAANAAGNMQAAVPDPAAAGGMPAGPGGAGGAPPAGGMPDMGGGSGGATAPSAEELMPDMPGTNPVTGDALETDPETGEPYPIDPVTGEAAKDIDEQGKLTVEHGERKLTMTEPGDDGNMAITVEGDGELSEYQLDFGSGDEADPETDEAFGPRGSGGEDAVNQVHRPGPDGKIHIKDGALELTAEQPQGADGPTVVTVDNGDGEPVTYTLGEENESTGEETAAGGAGTDTPPATSGKAVPENSTGDGGPGAGGSGGGGAGAASVDPPDIDSGAGSGATPTPDSGDSGGDTASGSPDSSATHTAAVDGGGGGQSDSGGGGGTELRSDQSTDKDSAAQSSSPSGARLGSVPGGDGPPAGMAQGGGSAAGSGGGMGMMGGMGAMGGGGGGQGGDQERTASAYRLDGKIFDTADSSVRISGTIGAANEVPIKFTR